MFPVKEAPSDPFASYERLTHGSPYPMAVFEGAGGALRSANPSFFAMADQPEDFLLGRSIALCLPKCPGCIDLLSRVSSTGQAELHLEVGYSEAWSFAAWPISASLGLPLLTMLLVTETSQLHQRAALVNEALLVSAVEQHEIVEVTKASADRLSTTIVQREEELGRTKEELQSLAFQLLQAHEDERRRIARELHDSFSQQLASLSLQMFHLNQELSSGTGQQIVGTLQSQLENLAGEVRALSHQLHPPTLEHLGLASSLRTLQVEFEVKHSLPIRVMDETLATPVSLQTATALYRIVQESLWNVVKHAGKDAFVTIHLLQDPDELTLLVEDTGIGFDPRQLGTQGRLGLISMQERARLVGGVMTIRSAPGEGTVLRVRVPLNARSGAEHSDPLHASDDSL